MKIVFFREGGVKIHFFGEGGVKMIGEDGSFLAGVIGERGSCCSRVIIEWEGGW